MRARARTSYSSIFHSLRRPSPAQPPMSSLFRKNPAAGKKRKLEPPATADDVAVAGIADNLADDDDDVDGVEPPPPPHRRRPRVGGGGGSSSASSSSSSSLTTFADLGLSPPLVSTCRKLGFARPTPVQRAVIPRILGRGGGGEAPSAGGGVTSSSSPRPVPARPRPSPCPSSRNCRRIRTGYSA